jgi:arylsulfatase A-like enzyme
MRELALDQNTIFIFCADNGTWGYGKASPISQKGTHVPLIIYAPWLTKHGEQDVLVNMCDMLPTIAELGGFKLPANYEINGESLVPFLFGDQPTHREWLYAYKGPMQIIRGSHVLRDGNGKWWDVSARPADLISFPRIDDWSTVSDAHRAERKKLEAILPRFDKHKTEHDAPGVTLPPGFKPKGGDEG